MVGRRKRGEREGGNRNVWRGGGGGGGQTGRGEGGIKEERGQGRGEERGKGRKGWIGYKNIRALQVKEGCQGGGGRERGKE